MSEQPVAYGKTIERALARVLERLPERLDPEALAAVCDELDIRPPHQQRLLARNSGRAGRLEVCWELVRQAEALRFSDPRAMCRRAEVAIAVAEGLSDDAGPSSLVEDVRAEAWACLANAHRVAGDLRAADRAWANAERHLAEGTCDPLLAALVARLKGTLRLDQLQLEEAIDLLSKALATYRKLGEGGLAGRTAVSLGVAHGRAGNLEQAIRSTLEGGRLLNRLKEPALVLGALRNLVLYLHHAGCTEHAASLLERLRGLFELAPQDLELLRLRWLEGKISAALGKQVEARAALNAVRREFLAKGMLYDGALVALELAALYAEAGWTSEVEKLAEEMYPVFVSRDLPREASAALLLFVDAVNRRAASAEYIRKLAADLSAKREAKS